MANDFTSDTGCHGHWRFQGSSLEVDDSTYANHLTLGKTTAAMISTSTYVESTSCFVCSSGGGKRADTALDSGFPFKSGTTNQKMSFSIWIQTSANTTGFRYIAGKHDGTNDKRSWSLWKETTSTTHRIGMTLGTTGGASWSTVNFGPVATGIWYNIGLRLNNDDRNYQCEIYNASNSAISSYSGTYTTSFPLTTAAFFLGWRSDNSSDAASNFLGLMDEAIVLNRILTDTQMQALRTQSFPVVVSESAGLFFCHG